MTGSPQPKSGVRSRTPAAARLSAARLAAVQALYQIEIAGGEVDDVVAEFLVHRSTRSGGDEPAFDSDPGLFEHLVREVMRRHDELDGLLSGALAANWPLERLEIVLRCILRVGACELVARRDVPAPVIITEHVDLAHAFFDGAEPGLVNGVLDRLARNLRPGELEEGSRDGTAPSR